MCEKEITLTKHTNSKHGTRPETQVCFSESSICEEKFVTESELQKHKDDHIAEIAGLDIKKSPKVMSYLSATYAPLSPDTKTV